MNEKPELEQLAELVAELKSLTCRAMQLASSNPAAARTLYMLRQHLETLEAEVSDPLRVLEAASDGRDV